MRFSVLFLGVLVLLPTFAAAGPSLLDQGITEYRAEQYEEAIATLAEARRQGPPSSLTAYYLGLAYKQSGELAKAVDQFRASLEIPPPAIDAYPELIESCYLLDDLVQARKWLARAEGAGVLPAPIAFLKGLVLAKEGEDREAAEAFRRAGELEPAVRQAAGLQVAMLQARSRQFDAARQSLRALIGSDPTSELATLAREYDAAFARIMEGHRAWRLGAGLSYIYDDNVLSKPTISLPGSEITGEEDSGMVGTVRFDYAPLLENGRLFSAQYLLNSTTYGSNDTHNTIIQSLTLQPGFEFSRGAVTFPLSGTYALLKQDNYMAVASVRPTLSLMTLPGHVAQLSAGYSRREMLVAPLAPDEDRDGDIWSASLGYLVTFAEGRGMGSLRYEFTEDDAVGANWANRGHRGSLGLLVPLAGGVKLTAGGDIYQQQYLHTHSVFGVERSDTIYSANAGASWDITENFSLTFNYGFTRADSNIGVYDYRRNTVTTGFECSF
jgi:tetratricopeptide (TPR) repeat protein